MKILNACEYSGTVRDAFLARGHNAKSVDYLPTEKSGPHHQGDVRPFLREWHDLVIAHPHCRTLAKSGLRWRYQGGRRWNPDATENPRDMDRWSQMLQACAFYAECWNANSDRVAVENSDMHPYAIEELERLGVPIRQARLYQPWMFATDETDNVSKGLHLLTRGLPPLEPLGIFDGTTARQEAHRESPGPDRWKNRSRTRKAVAEAFARHWGRVGT